MPTAVGRFKFFVVIYIYREYTYLVTIKGAFGESRVSNQAWKTNIKTPGGQQRVCLFVCCLVSLLPPGPSPVPGQWMNLRGKSSAAPNQPLKKIPYFFLRLSSPSLKPSLLLFVSYFFLYALSDAHLINANYSLCLSSQSHLISISLQ